VLGQVYAALGWLGKAIDHLEDSLTCFVELKSTYHTAKTRFQLGLVYLTSPDKEKQGGDLLNQARTIFANLGAQWDLGQVERAIERFVERA
jgi:hypothetical protein